MDPASLRIGLPCLLRGRDGQLDRAEVVEVNERRRGGLSVVAEIHLLLVDTGVRASVSNCDQLLVCPKAYSTLALPSKSFEVVLTGFIPRGTE